MRRRTFLIVAVVAAMLFATMAPAVAARGGKKGGGGKTDGSISIVEPAPYKLGQEINFDSSGSRESGSWIQLECYQGGAKVYFEANPVGGNYYSDDTFNLGPSPSWTSGNATCTAELGYWAKNSRWRVQASMSFSVDG